VSRVRLWVSAMRAIGHTLIIEHDDGSQECYPFKSPPAKGDRLGTSYQGEFRGCTGTFYDLPRGFPTDNHAAAQRLQDPSIPKAMKKLIVENFPIPSRARQPVNS
jgi:hypothetical protein